MSAFNQRIPLLGVFSFGVSAFCASPSHAQGPWKETIHDEGIRVFKRLRQGSAYEEVRAEARLAGKVEDFLPFFSEPPNYKKWVYGTLESEIVNRSNPFDFIFLGVFKIPWPFENRELVSRVEISRDVALNEITARLTHADSSLPVNKENVRVTRFESLWKVIPAEEKKVDLSIEMYVEPGGKLPPFIVNLVLSRIQLWSIKNLRKQIPVP
jgi:hypothetical protein